MRKEISHIVADHTYIFECPHCNELIQVGEREINCQIFRHGVMKQTWVQVGAHTSKKECDRLVEHSLIYGCGKPFRMLSEHGKWAYAEECEYN